jgi:hypothetical protein
MSHFKSVTEEYGLISKGDPDSKSEVKKEVESMFQHIAQQKENLFNILSKYRNQKENVDKKIFSIEIKSRGVLEFLLGYFLARKQTIEGKLENFILKNLKSFTEDRKAKIKLQEDLSEKQKIIEGIKHQIIFLDRIIEHTETLKNETLNEEEKKYFQQERERLRKEYNDELRKPIYENGIWISKEMGRYIRVTETIRLMFDQSLKELLGEEPINVRFCVACGNTLYGSVSLCLWCGAKVE